MPRRGLGLRAAPFAPLHARRDSGGEERGVGSQHTSAFVKPEDVLDRYMPQLQHNMAVAKAERAILSVRPASSARPTSRLGVTHTKQL